MMETMSRQSLGWTAVAAIVLVALPAWLRTAQTVPPSIGDAAQEDAVALRILFGLERIHPKTWDGAIALVTVIKNNTFVHTVRPEGESVAFEYRDTDIKPGESYYYVRVEQAAGQMAWSSPIWVTYSR
jgi:hypothetical protein